MDGKSRRSCGCVCVWCVWVAPKEDRIRVQPHLKRGKTTRTQTQNLKGGLVTKTVYKIEIRGELNSPAL